MIRLLAVLPLLAAAPVAAQKEFAPAPICRGAEDCDVKWGRAVSWILQRNPNVVQRTDDFLLTQPGLTYGHDKFQLNRIALGGGAYRIAFQFECASVLRCRPKKTVAEFADYVNSGG